MIEIKFTCNICSEVFISKSPKVKIPLGWGAVRPTLRVNNPHPSDKKSKKAKDDWWDFEQLCSDLKRQLFDKEYHLCHHCLKMAQGNILKLESGKKKDL